MHVSVPSKYVKATDLGGKAVRVTISHVAEEDVGQKRERKFCLYFQGKAKSMVLNATNIRAITAAYGEESGAWTGKPLILFGEQTTFAGQPTLGLRCRIPTDAPAAPAGRAPAPVQQQLQPAAAEPGEDWSEADDMQAEGTF